MPETSAMNCETEKDGAAAAKESAASIKLEVEVKPEPVECTVCVGRSVEALDMRRARTPAGSSLYAFLCRFTQADLGAPHHDARYVCKTCFDLINVLENAELEYLKLKETFESIISKNPLFDIHGTINTDHVKNEAADSAMKSYDDDSEDEPLALTKKKRHRKVEKRKKPTTVNKRKVRSKNSKDRSNDDERWECDICGLRGASGGQLAGAAHAIVAHGTADGAPAPVAALVKKEDSDRSESETASQPEGALKPEADAFDDDDDYTPSPAANGRHRKRAGVGRKKREAKVVHHCDQCNAKYTSLLRLEQHKLKHDDSKPPYICEVCGAHYKHKRACDIHVAMHKGISDWKCDECNKLFPSKGALQRHNNIHTGKLNYQCDLCGKSFIHTSSFKMHKLSHSGVKPHACDVCGLALMTRSHLKRHKRVHSGEKRHECGVCGKRFSERYNLLAHGKAHEGEPAPPTTPTAVPAPRRRLFRCGFCPERFERRYMLERHMGAAHGRALERPPPTPRNTMSKLLKAQAMRREPSAAAAVVDESKLNRSPESRAAGAGAGAAGAGGAGAALKLASQLSAAAAAAAEGAPAGWAGAYVAEFGLRPDYTH